MGILNSSGTDGKVIDRAIGRYFVVIYRVSLRGVPYINRMAARSMGSNLRFTPRHFHVECKAPFSGNLG